MGVVADRRESIRMVWPRVFGTPRPNFFGLQSFRDALATRALARSRFSAAVFL
jgi:hypothetical protein